MCPNINDNRHDDSDDRCPVMACSLQFAFQVRGCPDHAVEDTSTSSPCNHPMTMGKEYHFRIFQQKEATCWALRQCVLDISDQTSHLQSAQCPFAIPETIIFAEDQWDLKMKVPFWGISGAFAVSFKEFPTPQNLSIWFLIAFSRPGVLDLPCLKDLQIERKFLSRINKTRAKQKS